MMIHTYVASRLDLWARWRLRRDDNGQGYPRHAAFAKPVGGGVWSPEMDSAAYEMERCVIALRSDLRLVVIHEYTKTGTQEQKAKLCGCCLSTYKSRLNMAANELLGYLNDIYAGVDLHVHNEIAMSA